jgi:hypothetical protein
VISASDPCKTLGTSAFGKAGPAVTGGAGNTYVDPIRHPALLDFTVALMADAVTVGPMTATTPPEDNQKAKVPSRFWGVPIVLCGLAVALLVGRFEPATIAKASGNSTAAILFAAFIFWRARREIWYWVFLAVMSLVQVAIAFEMPWPQGNPPPGHKDLFLLFGLIDVIATPLLGLVAAKFAKTRSLN